MPTEGVGNCLLPTFPLPLQACAPEIGDLTNDHKKTHYLFMDNAFSGLFKQAAYFFFLAGAGLYSGFALISACSFSLFFMYEPSPPSLANVHDSVDVAIAPL
jgi:hypothetical protein